MLQAYSQHNGNVMAHVLWFGRMWIFFKIGASEAPFAPEAPSTCLVCLWVNPALAKELQKQAAELAQAEKVRLIEIESAKEREKASLEIQRQKHEAELQEKKATIELQRQKQEAEIAKELQKQDAEIARQKAELVQAEKAMELQQQKQIAEIEREIDLARHEQQRTLAESESRVRMHESDNRSRVTEDRVSGGGDSHNSFRKYDLGLGTFSNNDKDLEPFLTKFEVVAEAYKLPRNLWAG